MSPAEHHVNPHFHNLQDREKVVATHALVCKSFCLEKIHVTSTHIFRVSKLLTSSVPRKEPEYY